MEAKSKFLVRTGVFFLFYVLISFFYSDFTRVFHGYAFLNQDVYLYYLIFPLFWLFAYLKWGKIKKSSDYDNSILQTVLFLVISLGVFAIPLVKLIHFESGAGTNESSLPFLLYYSQIILGYLFLFLAIFNLKFLKNFKLEVSVLTLAMFLYLFTQLLVEKTWELFSFVITYALSFILPLFTKFSYVDLETFNVRMLDFNVYIGPPCAGIYSLMTFVFLFLVALAILGQNKKIDPFKSIVALLVGVIATFVLNIIRLVVIVLVGAYYSVGLAMNLFHEYLSAIFLIALFLVYLYFIIPRILED